MQEISIIILAKNSAVTIEAAIKSAFLISTDVIVLDSGSTDNTKQIISNSGAMLIETVWKGFGQTRNDGSRFALHDIIFCLDSDEVIGDELVKSIKSNQLDPAIIYGFKRKNFIGKKEIFYGEWGHDKVYRLYNRNHAAWNQDEVHEMIESRTNKISTIAGSLQHYTTDNLEQYAIKLDKYAKLSASKYKENNKKANFFKNYFSAPFSFIKNYFFRFGFLDGKEGWKLALLHAKYTNDKYRILRELSKKSL